MMTKSLVCLFRCLFVFLLFCHETLLFIYLLSVLVLNRFVLSYLFIFFDFKCMCLDFSLL